MGACCSSPPSVGPLLFSHTEKWDGLAGSQTDPNSCGISFAKCLLNGFASPFWWLWISTDTFLFGCAEMYCCRCCGSALKLLYCEPCGCDCFFYEDKDFPANSKSLGAFRGKTPDQIEADYMWMRGRQMFGPLKGADGAELSEHDTGGCCRKRPAALFEGKISSDDIAQGQLGDCWMMTAMASMAQYPGAVNNLFVTKEYNDRGKYTVRLFNGFEKKWNMITVDDKVPCERGATAPYTPIYARPKGRELWALLVEKAFAKMLGGYDKLNGGNILFGLHAFTGDPVYALKKQGNLFMEHELVMMKQGKDGKADVFLEKEAIGAFGPDDVFNLLKKFAAKKAVMGAGTPGTDEGTETAEHGLVRGHAYSILDVQDPQTAGSVLSWNKKRVRLVKLRNPWGKFEWTGAWGDGSPEWEQRGGKIKKKLRHQEADDGIFWMKFDDFYNEFTSIDLCDRSTGFRDIALHTNEENGIMGPCYGCTVGCAKFWLCCEGPKATCCGHRGHSRDLRTRDKIFKNKVQPV